MIMITILDLIIGPYLLSFYFKKEEDSGIIVNLIISVEICFILDLIVTFRTAFYDKGLLIVSKMKIIKHYLLHGFFLDVLVIASTLFAV